MNRNTCIGCGATNLGAQSACVVCGGRLAPACRHCGVIMVSGARWCGSCGGMLEMTFQPVGWRATHRVPHDGMAAWPAPDPSVPPSATLPGSLDVQVAEQLGAWSRVLCDNGWNGWVDGRLLQQIHRGSTEETADERR